MPDFYVYADEESIKALKSDQHKVILVGGDFGYANFGDVLQLSGTLDFYRQHTDCLPVPVYSLDAITAPGYVSTIRSVFQLDALLFISSNAVNTTSIDLVLVDSIPDVSALHLYGGGMMNMMWGGYVLDVVEFFLDRLQGVAYVVSGQQVGEEIRDRLTAHVNIRRPQLFGLRDSESLERITAWGIKGDFSFDDAYEPLMHLIAQIPEGKRDRVIGHMNISGYTRDDLNCSIENILSKFRCIQARYGECELTLANAYNDKRSPVTDSLGTVVAMENDFPYKNYSVIDLANAAYTRNLSKPELLAGRIGVSCSYHFTLFLHLADIPCWLIAQNAYYAQKARALNCHASFEAFIDSPQVPDYASRVAARRAWRGKMVAFIKDQLKERLTLKFALPISREGTTKFRWKESASEELKRLREYQFDLEKAREQLIVQVAELRRYAKALEDELGVSRASLSMHVETIEKCNDQLAELRAYSKDLESVTESMRANLQDMASIGSRKDEQISRLQALSEDLQTSLSLALSEIRELSAENSLIMSKNTELESQGRVLSEALENANNKLRSKKYLIKYLIGLEK